MKKLAIFISGICVISILAACGGGSGAISPVTANADPQGYWTGSSSGGYTVSTAILETGEVWGIYSAGGLVYGAIYGTSSVTGGNITITGTDFNFQTNTSSPGTLTGPFVAKSTMTLSSAAGSVPLRYQTSYDVAATQAAITGTWSFVGRSGSYVLTPAIITINSAGNFTLAQSNCVSIGAIVPRSGGKNIYNISLTASGAGCATGQSNLSGILSLDTTVTPNKFLSLALTSNKNDGLIVIGTKL